MKKFSVAFAALALAAPGAMAANSTSLKVSPSKVKRGKKVTVSGSVGSGCSGSATIYSRAFKGSTKQNFAGVPSVSAKITKGKFSIKVKINKKVKAKKYKVSGRCGGGNFGSASLTVKKGGSGGGGGGGFY